MTTASIELLLDLGAGNGPLHERLRAGLRERIRSGQLAAGALLPPSRSLAAELGCSRWVVTEAYGQLVAEGYLSARPGAGTRVEALPEELHRPAQRPAPTTGSVSADLAPGVPDLRSFPRSRWLTAYRQAVEDLEREELTGSGPMWRTTTAICSYLRRVRGVVADPGDLELTGGASAAVPTIASGLLRRGHAAVAVEDPSWPGLRTTLDRFGVQTVPIAVDGDGLRVDALHRCGARAVLITPTHQFPTGVVLSPERRHQLLGWAHAVGGVIIEDDYDAEFRYDHRPVATVQGMAPDRVIMIGSVSKTLVPGLRLGWMIRPERWRDDVDATVAPAGVFEQAALGELIRSGAYERHLRSRRLAYRARRERLLASLSHHLPSCRVSGLAAGLHFLLHLPAGTDADQVVARAAVRDVRVMSLDRYRMQPAPEPILVIGFGNLRDGTEDATVAALAAVITSVTRTAGRATSV